MYMTQEIICLYFCGKRLQIRSGNSIGEEPKYPSGGVAEGIGVGPEVDESN
jgi:hypothetical protein